MFPKTVVSFFICVFVYYGLEVLLETAALLGRFLLKVEVEPPFDRPHLSTSLQDFWARRWNRVASKSLRMVVFEPAIVNASKVMGRKWAARLALLATFLVSDLMHEILFCYLGRVRPNWGVLLFFLVHGFCLLIESVVLKRKNNNGEGKWKLPRRVVGSLVFGFTVLSFMWLALPELLEHKVDDRVILEFETFGRSFKDLSLSCYRFFLKRLA